MAGRGAGIAATLILALLAVDFGESVAEAGFVKQGVRPGQSGKVDFLRAPPAGRWVRPRPPGAGKAKQLPRPSARGPSKHDWFWAAHSPAHAAAGAARWALALASVEARRKAGRGIFGTDALRAIRTRWGPQIQAAARRHGVSDALLAAVIAVESGGRQAALSPKGAQGLMQLIPATARRFGVTDPYDPAANIAGGAAYLDWLLNEFDGDILLALAGYNAGEGAVRRHAGVPPYAETRAYVVLVLDALAAAGALCDGPPDGPRLQCRWKPEV